jgi:hypothetical protein
MTKMAMVILDQSGILPGIYCVARSNPGMP